MKKIINSILLSIIFLGSNFQISAQAMQPNEKYIYPQLLPAEHSLRFAHFTQDSCNYMNAAIEYYCRLPQPNSEYYDYCYMKYCEAEAYSYKEYALQTPDEISNWKKAKDQFTQAYLIAKRIHYEDRIDLYRKEAHFAKAHYKTLSKVNQRFTESKKPYTEKQKNLMLASVSSISSQDKKSAEDQNDLYCSTSKLYTPVIKRGKKAGCI